MARISFMPLICGALALTGCSGSDVLNAITSNSGVVIVEDVAYGPGPRQKLDVYRPEGADGPLPTIVYFYGGGWDSGSRDQYEFLGATLAGRGYQVAVPDYRIYPQARYPAFLEDSAAAVAWAKTKLGEVGAAPSQIFLMGHSAGAYNAIMLALDGRWLAAHDLAPADAIDGVAGLAGPYDFLPLVDLTLMEIFGPPEARPATQPINYVSIAAPPVFLATGAGDETVLPRNSRVLAEKLREAGARAELKVYDRVSHVTIIGSLAWPMRFLAPVLDDVDGFFRSLRPAG